MEDQKCSHCNGPLATVNGALICTNCGLVNKTALENKESYIAPTFFQERKLRQEKDNTNQRNFVNRIKSDLAYIVNFLNLSKAVQNQAFQNILGILKRERLKTPSFPFHSDSKDVAYNCLIAIGIIISIYQKVSDFYLLDELLQFFKERDEILTLEDIKKFNSELHTSYDVITSL